MIDCEGRTLSWRFMSTAPRQIMATLGVLLLFTTTVAAQSFQTVGTRAQGMAGAFVSMADDASAVYWNPAGLARGAYFSLVLDGSTAESTAESARWAAHRGGWLLALSTPALGVSYYRLRTTAARPAVPDVPESLLRLDSLVTHHAGVTFVQSLTDGVAVGATAKLIRGVAASGLSPIDDPAELLDGWDLIGRTSTRGDLDVGIMATGALGSVGLTVRNLTEPSFRTGEAAELRLDRQIRAGASIVLLPTWKLATDLDLTKSASPSGDVRELAVGTEGSVTHRITARGGFRFNTTGDAGRAPSVSVGGSFAVMGSFLVDAQVTGGSDQAFRGWAVAGRMVF